MDDIDEATAPPKPEEEEEFRPYYPEKAEDEGFLTQQGLKKKLSRLGEGWLVPEPRDEITGMKLESRNVKALFRRAQAYIETNDLDLAEMDLKKALEMEPDNGEVNLQLARLKKLQSYYDKKESKLFVNMLGKLRV